MARLQALFEYDPSNQTPMSLVEQDLCDPVKIFIKDEPHTLEKVQQGRFRIICGVSLVDNVIARLLCSLQNNTEILNWKSLPVKPGMGLHDEGLQSLYETACDISNFNQHPLVETDVSGWDWTFQQRDFDNDLQRRLALNNSAGTVFEKIITSHFHCMARKVFMLSDGSAYEQVHPGVMPSGWYNTSSTNSSARIIDHLAVCNALGISSNGAMSMGDDCAETFTPMLDPEKIRSAYMKRGKRIKNIALSTPSDFTFCSQQFVGEIAYPINIAKQLYQLLSYKTLSPEDRDIRLAQFYQEMRHLPNLQMSKVIEAVEHSGWKRKVFTQLQSGIIGSPPVKRQNVELRANKNAERPHGENPLRGVGGMNGPRQSFAYPIQMTNKKTKTASSTAIRKLTNKVAALQMQKTKTKKTKKTPFGDTGSIVGSKVGAMFGSAASGNSIGRWLGTGIGSIFGSGDYTAMGPRPEYNILSGQVPKFSSTHATNIVCHREYLGDINGTAGFSNTAYPLNPGMSATFPWLATIAANYQQYKFHGLVFEFRSLVTDFVTAGSPGVLVMTTNYNADQAPFVSRQEAENAEFAVATKPTVNLSHMIECKPSEVANKLYNVRTGAVPLGQDLRLYDYGNTQVITQTNPTINLGELWVTYCVEFFKPTLSLENSVLESAQFHSYRVGTSAASPLGTAQVTYSGSLVAAVAGNSISVSNATPGAKYLLTLTISGSVAATTAIVIPTLVGCVASAILNNGAAYSVNTTGTLCTFSTEQVCVLCTASTMTFNFAAGSVLPTGSTSCEIYLTVVDPSITA